MRPHPPPLTHKPQCQLLVTSPFYDKITLDLPGAPQPLVITAPGASTGKPYVAGLTLNGVPLSEPRIPHDAIRRGGTLEFEMSAAPAAWASETVAGRRVNALLPGGVQRVLTVWRGAGP